MTTSQLSLLGAVGLTSLVNCSAGPDRETSTTVALPAVTREVAAFGHNGPHHRDAGHHRAGIGGGAGGPVDDGGEGGGTSGSGGEGGGGTTVGIAVTPDATGWIDGSSNALGIQGAWYAFADGYGLNGVRGGSCQAAGHADSECSVVTTPDLSVPGFPNTAGRMCLAGTATQVLPMAGLPDWGNMWGAGMGFDLNNAAGTSSTKGAFDASARGIVGIAFDIDALPLLGLRVEFPTTSTAGTAVQPYWGASEFYPNSPVSVGRNVLSFSDVQTPEAVPQPLETTQIQVIQFHIPAYEFTIVPFSFCISNVTFLVAQ